MKEVLSILLLMSFLVSIYVRYYYKLGELRMANEEIDIDNVDCVCKEFMF